MVEGEPQRAHLGDYGLGGEKARRWRRSSAERRASYLPLTPDKRNDQIAFVNATIRRYYTATARVVKQTTMQHWFAFPNIDPVAVHLGAVSVHWYGLSYLVGFIVVGLWMARPAGLRRLGLTADEVQDLLVTVLAGLLIGARVFFVIA